MRISTPNFISPVVSTDQYGFRHTICNSKTISVSELINTEITDVTLCIGSSALFGVGSSGNGYTITSYLSKLGIACPINLGNRACNSTQELIAFTVFLPLIQHKLKRVLFFSGVNDMTLSMVGDSIFPYINPLFNSQAIALQANKRTSISHLTRMIFSELKQRLRHPNGQNPISSLPRKDAWFHTFSTIDAVNRICRSRSIPCTYFFQPLAPICKKNLSREEEILFGSLDNPELSLLRSTIAEEYHKHVYSLKTQCADHRYSFVDLNNHILDNPEDWLFVDSIHLSDKGSEVCARIIAQYLTP